MYVKNAPPLPSSFHLPLFYSICNTDITNFMHFPYADITYITSIVGIPYALNYDLDRPCQHWGGGY